MLWIYIYEWRHIFLFRVFYSLSLYFKIWNLKWIILHPYSVLGGQILFLIKPCRPTLLLTMPVDKFRPSSALDVLSGVSLILFFPWHNLFQTHLKHRVQVTTYHLDKPWQNKCLINIFYMFKNTFIFNLNSRSICTSFINGRQSTVYMDRTAHLPHCLPCPCSRLSALAFSLSLIFFPYPLFDFWDVKHTY